jgi:superfamily II DNA or RNA helicase
MQLRPYQTEAISLLRDGFQSGHQRQVYQLATGGGKTLTFSSMVVKAAQRGTRTLILTNRVELLKQTFSALGKVNLHPQVLDAKSKFYYDNPVTIAMVETIARRLKKGWQIPAELIIVDEAHIGSFNKIIDLYPNARVIGATATPVGKHFHQYYTNLVSNIDIPDLIEQGYLCSVRAYQMQDDFTDVPVINGEFKDDALFSHFNKAKLYQGVIEKYQEVTPGKKAMCFCVNVEHTQRTYAAFKEAGLSAYMVHSKMTDEERKWNQIAFEADACGIMVNCGILTTGYDHPPVEVIIVDRATLSLPLWLQMCGRGSRPSLGKTYFTVLDFGMNHNRHGRWDQPRIWEIEAPKKRNPKESTAAVKTCPGCDAMLFAAARVCEYCGFVYPDSETERKEGVLVEVEMQQPSQFDGRKLSTLSVVELMALEKTKRYKPQFIWRVIRSKGEGSLVEYATEKKYKRGWLKRQIEEMQAGKNNFSDITLR